MRKNMSGMGLFLGRDTKQNPVTEESFFSLNANGIQARGDGRRQPTVRGEAQSSPSPVMVQVLQAERGKSPVPVQVDQEHGGHGRFWLPF